MAKIRAKHYIVTDYWHAYYCSTHCTLCGNRGWLDTRGTQTAAGVEVGRINWCICPNGQALRRANPGTNGPSALYIETMRQRQSAPL